MNTNILQTLCAFLRTAPAMQGIALTAEQLPPGDADAALQNAQRLETLQAWLAAQSAAHTAPTFGNYDTETETLRTADACMERADAGGTACYTLRLWADYTVAYTEKGELV